MTILGKVPVTVTNQGAATYVDGVLVPGASSTRTIEASVQPISGRERETLPEGWRVRARWKMYTTASLSTVDLEVPAEADQVAWGDDLYDVVSVADWQTSGLGSTSHRKYVLVLRGEDEP